MYTINISVREKIATHTSNIFYVCGNSDFVVHFDFDADWDGVDTKTARFISENGVYQDQVFTGSDCPVPIISNTNYIRVGVFAGNLQTTTPARVQAARSILCGAGSPADPSPDVYNQIMEKLNQLDDDIGGAVQDYLEKNPIEGTSFETDETLTLQDGILSVNTADVVEQDNTLPVTSAAVYTEVGNINALLETI